MYDIYNLGASAGLGITASGIFYAAYLYIRRKVGSLAFSLKFTPETRGFSKEDKHAMVSGITGGILLSLLGIGTSYFWMLMCVGVAAGAGVCKGIYAFRRTAELYAKRRQVAVLFEAVEMYLRSNMSLVQALYAAKSLTPLLANAVRSCIVRWPSSPENALENLRRDIGVPEADVLVSLLLRINITGLKNLEGVIQREAQNIDKLRNVAAKMKISSRPTYFMLHRALPVIAILGMFLGSMFYHLSQTLQAAGVTF